MKQCMSGFHQLLHAEEFHCGGELYLLFAYRGDGGIVGKWRCGECESEPFHDACLTFASLDGCLESMKRTIREHHDAADRNIHGAARAL